MNKLCNLIELYKKGEKESIVDIIDIFNPLLNKFKRDSYYEDIENELILFLITLLNKISDDKKTFLEDKYAFSYIHKSLKNKYIDLNTNGYLLYNKETNNDLIFNYKGYEDSFNNIIFHDMIKDLSISEKNIINKRYVYNLSEADIARELNISRQAVHKTHKRALTKLKKIYSK